MRNLIESAQRAFDTVKLYRLIYGKKPEVIEDIPFISHVHFHRARHVLDCVARGSEILGAVPGLLRGRSDLPLTALESADEWDYRLNRLDTGLQHLDIFLTTERYKILIVADQITGVFASYLSDQLGWLKHQASISYIDFSECNIEDTISHFDPDLVLNLTAHALPGVDTAENTTLVSIIHVNNLWQKQSANNQLLVCDELHVIGARRTGEQHFCYGCSHILFEVEPKSARLAITLPDFSCWPWIRYTVGCNIEPGAGVLQNVGQI